MGDFPNVPTMIRTSIKTAGAALGTPPGAQGGIAIWPATNSLEFLEVWEYVFVCVRRVHVWVLLASPKPVILMPS